MTPSSVKRPCASVVVWYRPDGLPQLLATRVQDHRHGRLGGVGHQRTVNIGRQPVGQAAAEHDGRGARQQPPVIRREPAEFLRSDVRAGLPEPQDGTEGAGGT